MMIKCDKGHSLVDPDPRILEAYGFQLKPNLPSTSSL